ncbi:protein-histidine kinase [Gigaspora margarita]|uniref:histidine kinase n=1 Tax=Gigaspora margarita TaxID=4874 RepID=A0A8H4AMC1_GIGMA|nr:protein-histidine kinase [Gigaspora margarita]
MNSWDPALINAVSLCLKSAFPTCIYVIPGWIELYNKALGKPFNEVWPEIYDIITSQFENVRISKKGFFKKDAYFELQRDGYIEEAYFNYTFSPILKSDGSVCAIFSLAQETTHKVLNARRLKIMGEFGHLTSKVESLENACHIVMKVLSNNNADIPYALIYFVDHNLIARLIATTFNYDDKKEWNIPDYLPEILEIIDLTKDVDKNYDTYIKLKREAATYTFLKCESWPIHLVIKEKRKHIKVLLKNDSQAVLFSTKLDLGEGKVLSAILICGVNQRRTLDEKYMEFLQLVANQMNTFLLHAKSNEEERKRSKTLADLNHQKVMFFQGISHELKTPLTLMLSPLDDLINACSREAQIIPYLQIIRPGEDSKIEGLDRGADDYLIKPFSAQELIARILSNIELSHIRRKIIFQQYKQEEIKQLLLSILDKIFSGLDLNEILLDIVKELCHRLPSQRVFIVLKDQSEFKNNKIIAIYEDSDSECITPKNNLFIEINDTYKNKLEFLNNKPGIDICLDVYCDDVCKNVSILSMEIKVNNICWGWIKVYRSPNPIWLDSEIELLQQISNQISLVINYTKILEENTANEIKVKAAEAAIKAKSQILANTSHELRTPLGALVGILSSFEDTSFVADQKDMINIMIRSSDVVLSLVDDILDANYLRIQLNHLKKKAGAKKIELIVNCEIDMLPRYVKSDPDSLKQVLSNLLSNSIKFTNEGKSVLTISIKLQVIEEDKSDQIIKKGILLIELYDTSTGMDPEYIKHVWKSFSQGIMSITEMQDDIELGLSICKNLVEINGGEINVDNQLGKGKDARNAMLKYLKMIEKVDAFDTFDKGIIAAKRYKELNNQSAYDIVFIRLYKNNEEEIIKATLELRELEVNSNHLVIIFIVFPNNEGIELAKKLIEKVGGKTFVLYSPITWKKLTNQFMHIGKKNYATDKNNKSPLRFRIFSLECDKSRYN